jgi:intracellular septation protein
VKTWPPVSRSELLGTQLGITLFRSDLPHRMKLLFDLFPVILFFAAYKMYDIYIATAVAIVASILQVGYLLARRRKVEPMMWLGLGIIVVAGGATIVFKNEMFIKWKPTVLFAAMAATIGIAQFWFRKNPIAFVFNNTITAPDHVWRKLSISWIAFLLFIAVLNLWFAYYTSTDTWVLFKTFGDMGLFFVFIVLQIFWLLPYLPDDNADEPKKPAAEAATIVHDASSGGGKV